MNQRQDGAVARGREVLAAVAEAIEILDEEDEEHANAAIELIDRLWAAARGHGIDALMTEALVDAVSTAARNLDEKGFPEDDAAARYGAKMSIELLQQTYPELASRVDLAEFARVVRVWRTSSRADARARGRGKGDASRWRAVCQLIRSAGLAARAPETMRREWATLRSNNRRRTP